MTEKDAAIERLTNNLSAAIIRRIYAETAWRKNPSPETEAALASAAAVERAVIADVGAVKVYR